MTTRDEDGHYCLVDGWRRTVTLADLELVDPGEPRRRRREPHTGRVDRFTL